VIITGCAKGLGQYLALRLASHGATIIGHYKDSTKEALVLQKKLQAMNPRSRMFQANLRDEQQTKKMFKEIISQHKRIDVLINLVGNFSYKPFEKFTLEDLNDVIETNITSTFLCSKLAIEQMKRQKKGAIINFGCAGADRLTIQNNTTLYYMAKTGVLMLTKIFAKTYAKFGIRVNAISPGILSSSVVIPKRISQEQIVTFNEIFQAIESCISPQSKLNGENIEIAKGWKP